MNLNKAPGQRGKRFELGILENPNLTSDELLVMWNNATLPAVRLRILQHKNTSADLLLRVAKNLKPNHAKSPLIDAIARHTRSTPETITTLKETFKNLPNVIERIDKQKSEA